MSFIGLSIFRFGCHFVQQSGTILEILKYHPRNILKSGYWPRKCCLKVFLFLALVAILCSRVDNLSNFGRGPQKENPINFG